MNRLLATLALDVRLQFRNGFYYASAFVAVVLIVGLNQIPGVDWSLWWPVIILENLVVNGYFFMAALVMLERAEGTLDAQVVTPLGSNEYLASKALTLGFLSVLETFVVVAAVSGLAFNWIVFLVGVVVLVAIYAFYGFWVVARYSSISEALLPSSAWTLGFSLPLLYYFDIWRHPAMFLHPLQAPLVLIQAAFDQVPVWQVVYGLAYGMLWVGIAYAGSRRAFHKFVVVGAKP